MDKKKSLLLASLTLTFIACAPKVIYEKEAANNKEYKVSYLFEHDGCKVYRFYDHGTYIYFTNCEGETMQADSTAKIRNRTTRRTAK
jgi:hypothetical protein